MKRYFAYLLVGLFVVAAHAADTKGLAKWEKDIAAFEAADRTKILAAPDNPANFTRLTIRANDFSETHYLGSVTATNGTGKYAPPSADAAQPGTIIVLRVLQSSGIFINIF